VNDNDVVADVVAAAASGTVGASGTAGAADDAGP
jgi:hypothetical protein